MEKVQDHSVLAILVIEDSSIRLFYMHEFPLNTPYTNVIGNLAKAHKALSLQRTLIDQTGIGEPILEETQNQNITTAQGITFTQQTKEQIEQAAQGKVKTVLEEFSRKDGSARKRVMNLNDVYPTHEQFMKKLNSLNTEGLAQALRILAFLAQTKIYLIWQTKQNSLRQD